MNAQKLASSLEWVYSHNIWPQTFSCVEQFMQVYQLTLPTPKQRIERSLVWRLTDRIKGQIHGLPGTWGILLATNGILCYIEQGYGRPPGPEVPVVLGHLQWFVPDEQEHFDLVKAECAFETKAIVEREAKLREALLEAY